MEKVVSCKEVRSQIMKILQGRTVQYNKEEISEILSKYDLKLDNRDRCVDIDYVDKGDVIREILFLLNMEIKDKNYKMYLSEYSEEEKCIGISVIKKVKINVKKDDYDFIFARERGILYIPYEEDVVEQLGTITPEFTKTKMLYHKGILVPYIGIDNNWMEGGRVIRPWIKKELDDIALEYFEEDRNKIENFKRKLVEYNRNWCGSCDAYFERVDNFLVLHSTFYFDLAKDFTKKDIDNLKSEIFYLFDFLLKDI